MIMEGRDIRQRANWCITNSPKPSNMSAIKYIIYTSLHFLALNT